MDVLPGTANAMRGHTEYTGTLLNLRYTIETLLVSLDARGDDP